MTVKTFAQVDQLGNVTCVCQLETSEFNIQEGFTDPSGLITFKVPPDGVDYHTLMQSWKLISGEWTFIGAQPTQFHSWDGTQWVYDLDMAKTNKWMEIKQERGRRETGGFVWDTSNFDSDPISQSRIQGAIQLSQMDPTLVLDWTLADNTVRSLSASDLAGVGVALGQHVTTLHVTARGLRTQIEAATTQAELEAIAWPV